MKEISPVNIWKDGVQLIGVYIYLLIVYDNLLNTATFCYNILDAEQSQIAIGKVEISGQDYDDWGTNEDINSGAYNYCADKLGLTITNQQLIERN